MKFFCNNANGGTPQSLSTSFKTIVALLVTSGALRRVYVEEVSGSASDVPSSTDGPLTWDLSLVTADGTGTASAPQPSQVFETGTENAALTTGKANYTAEPTVTASTSRLILSPNQRSVLRWAALSDDHRPSCPGVAASGFSWRAHGPTGGYASTVNGNVIFSE